MLVIQRLVTIFLENFEITNNLGGRARWSWAWFGWWVWLEADSWRRFSTGHTANVFLFTYRNRGSGILEFLNLYFTFSWKICATVAIVVLLVIMGHLYTGKVRARINWTKWKKKLQPKKRARRNGNDGFIHLCSVVTNQWLHRRRSLLPHGRRNLDQGPDFKFRAPIFFRTQKFFDWSFEILQSKCSPLPSCSLVWSLPLHWLLIL